MKYEHSTVDGCRVIQFMVLPVDFYGGYQIANLDAGEINDLIKQFAPTEIRYWYGIGSYEGSGQLLIKSKNKWYHHDMSHCSCYGPIENIKLTDGKSLKALYESCSDELKKQIEPLVFIKED